MGAVLAADDIREPAQGQRISPGEWLCVLALYLLAVAVYLVLASKQPIPLVTPDEWTYGGAARSLADGKGLNVLGEPANLKAALYVYLITPAWWLGSTVDAYGVAKAIGTVSVCLTIIPVWWLARQFTTRWIALIPAVLMVAGTWMTSAASLLTENAALPFAASALTAGVMALRRPGSAWVWWAIGFSALATWARMQVGVLFVVLLIAMLVDGMLLRPRHTWRARLERHRAPLAVLAALLVVGLIVVLSTGRSALGFYSSVTSFTPSFGDVATQIGRQALALTIMTAIVPVALALAAAAAPSAWRDEDRLRPLLAVGLTAAVAFVLQSAWFNAGVGAPHSIQRYVVYGAPLLLVLAVVIPTTGLVPLRTMLGASALVALGTFASPGVAKTIEERGLYGLWLRFGDGLGLSTGVAVGLVAIAALGTTMLVLWRVRQDAAAVGVGVVIAAVLVVQSQAGWQWQLDITRAFRAQFAGLGWVDQHTRPGVTRMFGFGNSPLTDVTELFNRHITQTLVPPDGYIGNPARGKRCELTIDANGVVQIPEPCDPEPRQIWNNDPLLRLTFANGRLLASDRFLGQVFGMTGGRPQIEAGVVLPCTPPTLSIAKNGTQFGPPAPAKLTCRNAIEASTFLSRPGSLMIRFQGGRDAHRVQVDDQVIAIPPGSTTAVRVPIPAGPNRTQVPTDWQTTDGAPRIVSVTLEEQGRSTRIL